MTRVKVRPSLHSVSFCTFEYISMPVLHIQEKRSYVEIVVTLFAVWREGVER